MRVVALALAALPLAGGCAPERAAPAQAAPSPLVGKTRADLLACAGAPDRAERAGDAEVLVYAGVAARRVPGTLTRFGETRWEQEVFRCEAAFTIQGGRVARVTYRGSRAPAADDACAAIAARCR